MVELQQSEVVHIQAETDSELEVTQQNPTETSPTTGLHLLDISISRFGTLGKLIAVTAYVLRFIYNTKQPTTSRRTGPLTTSELAPAKSGCTISNTQCSMMR